MVVFLDGGLFHGGRRQPTEGVLSHDTASLSTWNRCNLADLSRGCRRVNTSPVETFSQLAGMNRPNLISV